MLITTAELHTDDVHDVCIIGAGPAGVSAALRLAALGRRVLLLEGGDQYVDGDSQDVYRGTVVGDPYFELDYCRLRAFGGTTGHWSGWCRPLDAWDFEPKPGFDKAHWPIRRADLDPYLADACDVLDVPAEYDDRPMDGGRGVEAVRFRFSPPTRIEEKYFETIAASPDITLCLRANVFRLEPAGGRIGAVEVLDYEGGSRMVRAGAFVLACGGIENSRILLHSNALANGAVVPRAETLGRYWMEHPHFTVGATLLFGDLIDREGGHYALDDATRRRLGVLACGIRLEPTTYGGTKKIVSDIACVAPGLSTWAFEQIGYRLACGARVRAAWEQAPDPANHVALSATETDRFGVPRAELHWRKSAADLRTMRETALQIGAWLAETGQGRMRLEGWVTNEGDYPAEDELAGYHHMGGTRMADSPSDGVVDADCRVWGVDNLYVAGSSVFPSAGHANPTLTIVQLALRLGEHIDRRLGAG
jgi:choline dehydrogenase-like flavoprotein